ncbi:MAG: hypothetical protein ACI4VG_03845 [Lachnospiraceae bacterium]
MKKKTLIYVSIIMILILSVMRNSYSNAATAFGSKGKFIYNNNTPENEADDVIFDSADLITLDNRLMGLDSRITALAEYIEQGVRNIVNALEKYPHIDFGREEGEEIPSFDAIVAAINQLTLIPPDTYFYEENTEGDENIVRYKKINGKYYRCSAQGSVAEGTPEEEISGKTLIAYRAAEASNITAGSAAYVEGVLHLGNGGDNTAYYERGSTESKVITRIKIGTGSLGNTKTFDITGYEGWETFTLDNFAWMATGATVVEASGVGVNTGNSYNSQTGILSIGAAHGATIVDSRHMRGYASYDVYLIY